MVGGKPLEGDQKLRVLSWKKKQGGSQKVEIPGEEQSVRRGEEGVERKGQNSPSQACRLCGNRSPTHPHPCPPWPPLLALVTATPFLSLLCPFCGKVSGTVLSGLCPVCGSRVKLGAGGWEQSSPL